MLLDRLQVKDIGGLLSGDEDTEEGVTVVPETVIRLEIKLSIANFNPQVDWDDTPEIEAVKMKVAPVS